jgi:hypothetical protein
MENIDPNIPSTN